MEELPEVGAGGKVEISWSRPWTFCSILVGIGPFVYTESILTTFHIVQDHKLLVSALAFVGFASVTSQLLAFLSVFAQTFILSGTKVSF